MLRRWIGIICLAISMGAFGACAETSGDAGAAATMKKQKAERQEIVLTGVISRVGAATPDDKKKAAYILTDEAGNETKLPASKMRKGGKNENGFDLDTLVGRGVTLTGTGTLKKKKGKTVISLKSVTHIEVIGDVMQIDIF